MVPATIYYQVALCGSSLPPVDLIQAVHQQPRWRPCSPTEVNGLRLGLYWGADTGVGIMVPLDTMATILQGLSQEHENLEDAIRCLQDLAANSTVSGVCHSSIASEFPQIGRCGFPRDEVKKKLSLKATHPQYHDINTPEGLAFTSQVAAAEAFFKNPPVGSGLSSPTPPATFWLKVKKVKEFFDYCINYEELTPHFDYSGNTTWHVLYGGSTSPPDRLLHNAQPQDSVWWLALTGMLRPLVDRVPNLPWHQETNFRHGTSMEAHPTLPEWWTKCLIPRDFVGLLQGSVRFRFVPSSTSTGGGSGKRGYFKL